MLKNVSYFRFSTGGVAWDLTALEHQVQAQQFRPCGPTEDLSCGWAPPRHVANSPFVESVAGSRVLEFVVEKKSVPASVVNAALAQRCREVEEETGRKPGKRQKQELKEEVYRSLLPRAFSKKASTLVVLQPETGWLVVGSASTSFCDEVVTAVLNLGTELGSVPLIQLVRTAQDPGAVMSRWLVDGAPADGFEFESDCELCSLDESRTVVRYLRHQLGEEDVAAYIQNGLQVSKLSLNWQDKLLLELGRDLCLRKLKFLDDVFVKDEDKDTFDADMLIAIETLNAAWPEVLKALGGEAPESSD